MYSHFGAVILFLTQIFIFFPENLNSADPLITTRVDEAGQQIIIVSGTQDFDGLAGKGLSNENFCISCTRENIETSKPWAL